MSERYITRLFKPKRKPNIANAVLSAARKIGAFIRMAKAGDASANLRIGAKKGVYTADLPFMEGDHLYFTQLAQEIGGVWLEMRIQEGSHWDYTLSYPYCSLDDFSVLPEYWDDDVLMKLVRLGRPDALAMAWGVDVGEIDNYLKQWGRRRIDEDTYECALRGKAYPGDEFEYGDYQQIFDTLKKLHYTQTHKWFFEIRLPEVNYSPKRNFVHDISEK